MTTPWRSRLDALITAKGFNRKSLSKAAGFGETYLRDVIDLGREPGVDKLDAICSLLGVSVSAVLYGDDGFAARVRIVGSVSAGESWIPVDDGEEVVEMSVTGGEAIGLEVRGDSMRPVYRPGDVLIGAKIMQPTYQRIGGLDCVVMTARGERFVKFVVKGTARNRFNLRSWNPAFDDVENVELDWAAPIEWVRRAQR